MNPLWTPSPGRVAATHLSCFIAEAGTRWHRRFSNYAELHRWSIDQPQEFWQSVWQFCDVLGASGSTVLESGAGMLDARWFPQSRLNYAHNLLRRRDQSPAIVFWGEDRVKRRVAHAELYRQVAAFAAALRTAGIGSGDRVAAYMPNLPETLVAMLATTSLGAIFTSASPDFGVQGVLDRFGQIQPKILVAADGYFYNRKSISVLERVAEIVARLPSVETTVVVGYIESETLRDGLSGIRNAVMFDEFTRPHQDQVEIAFESLPFDHPLYILYSSGTTGAPKCIVHRAGGVVLQHLKEHRLHADIKPGDRLFYFTTCGWMMWNWLVSALASEATVLLYDGSPLIDDGRILFDFVAEEQATHFGASAKYLDAIAKNGLQPRTTHNLGHLRTILSTGSPLAAEGYDYVYKHVKQDVQLASISGGTDIVSCFVLGNPMAPVYRGEIQCPGLGMAVNVFDETGEPVTGAKGELVCTRPFPVMPLGFWNDPKNHKYQAAYFERYPGVWHHGDFAECTARGGYVIYGRSDATLNPAGVRIGTAEIYRQVEKLPEVIESLVIGQDWNNDVRIVLFVRLREGLLLDATLIDRIRRVIRENATPRHVPQKVLQVSDIPRTKSGKIVELAVRNVVHGLAVKNIEALANPEALEHYRNRPELAQ